MSGFPFQASHFGIKCQSTNHVFLNPLLGPHFSHLILICSKNGQFGDPLKIQMVPKRDRKTTKWRKIGEKYKYATLSGPFLKTLIHAETPSGLNLRVFYLFRFLHFPILAAPLSKNTCFFFFRWRHIHRETPSRSALRNPVAAKREAKKKNKRVDPLGVSLCIWLL